MSSQHISLCQKTDQVLTSGQTNGYKERLYLLERLFLTFSGIDLYCFYHNIWFLFIFHYSVKWSIAFFNWAFNCCLKNWPQCIKVGRDLDTNIGNEICGQTHFFDLKQTGNWIMGVWKQGHSSVQNMAFLHVFQLFGPFNKALIAFVKVPLLLNLHVLANICKMWQMGIPSRLTIYFWPVI